MGFSPLATMSRRIPEGGRSSARNSPIRGFTIHHQAGVNAMGEATNPNRVVSANYWITHDGTIIPHIDENRRAWTTGAAGYPAGAASDHRNITVEVSNSPEGVRNRTWAISAPAMASLTALIGDVFARHNLGPVRRGTQSGVAVHRDFVPTACPGPYIMARLDSIILNAERHRRGQTSKTPTQPSGKDWFSMATKQDLKDAIWEVLSEHNISISGATKRILGRDQRSAFALIRYAAADLFEGRERHAETLARIEGLNAALRTLAESQGVDPDQVTNTVETAVERALKDLSITLTVEGDQDDD